MTLYSWYQLLTNTSETSALGNDHSDQTMNTHYNTNTRMSTSSLTCWIDICAVGSRSGIRFPATFLSHWRQFICLTDQTHTIEVVSPESFLIDPKSSCLNISLASDIVVQCHCWNACTKTEFNPRKAVHILHMADNCTVRKYISNNSAGEKSSTVASEIQDLS